MNKFDLFTYSLLKQTSAFLRHLNIVQRQKLALRLTRFIYSLVKVRKKTALKNIRKSFPFKTKHWHINVLKQSYLFFVQNLLEFLAFPDAYPPRNISVSGRNILDEALKQNKGVILVSGHFGAWEILGAWLGNNNYSSTGVAQRQRNKGADRFFRELREFSGIKHIFRKETLNSMYSVLGRNEILILVSDQDAKKRGVFVNFLGRLASTPKGAARFNINTKAPIVFSVCRKTDINKAEIYFEKIDTSDNDIQSITQNYTSLLEKHIKEYPAQYFWFHRRWKTKYNNV